MAHGQLGSPHSASLRPLIRRALDWHDRMCHPAVAAISLSALLALWVYRRIHGPQSREAIRSLTGLGFWVLLIIVGISIIVAYPGAIPTGVAALAAGAGVTGAAFGFLFGIPRALVDDAAGRRSRVNTNLEQVSDWLTKILLGAGLTQIAALPEHGRATAEYFATWVSTERESGERLAAITLLYFAVCGFFLAYLWTRLYLSSALESADHPLSGADGIS